jgi:hypothetical protein
MRQKAERLTKELKELIEEVLYVKGKEDIFHKIEQLKVVNESIEQLEEKNVIVPDDLRRLKSELSGETVKHRESYDVLIYLAEELKKIEKDLKLHLSGKKTSKLLRRKS